MSIQVWSKNLKKHYPNVNVEKVTVGERGKGYIVYVDGERMALNHFFAVSIDTGLIKNDVSS